MHVTKITSVKNFCSTSSEFFTEIPDHSFQLLGRIQNYGVIGPDSARFPRSAITALPAENFGVAIAYSRGMAGSGRVRG